MLDAIDLARVEAARDAIRKRYKAGWHEVGCALRTRSGRVHVGVHLECRVGRIAVCAEAVAIGRAATDGDDGIEVIVAVHQTSDADDLPAVVAPCGMCREMICDYAPEAEVIMPANDGTGLITIASLLPRRYRRS